MAFWFGINSMVRSAGLGSCSSIPQSASRSLLPALLSSSSPSSTVQQAQLRQQQNPQQLSQTPTRYQHHQNPLPSPLPYSHLQPRNPFAFLPPTRQQQRKGEIALRSSPIQRLQLQAPPSSRCSYCLTGTGFTWTSGDDHGYDHEVFALRDQVLSCRWREWDG
jgi:hypothetical protein